MTQAEESGGCDADAPSPFQLAWLEGSTPRLVIVGEQTPEWWIEVRLSAQGKHQTWTEGPWERTEDETPILDIDPDKKLLAELVGDGGIVSLEVTMVAMSANTGEAQPLEFAPPRWFTRDGDTFVYRATLDGVTFDVEPIEGDLPLAPEDAGEVNAAANANPERE